MDQPTITIIGRNDAHFDAHELRRNDSLPSDFVNEHEEAHLEFKNLLKETMPDHISDALDVSEKEANRRTEAFLKRVTATYDFDEYGEVAERDAYSHQHGHGTEPDGINMSVTSTVKLTAPEEAVMALGLNSDELTDIMSEVAHELRMGDDALDLTFNDTLKQTLDTIKNQADRSLNNTYMVIPKTLPGIVQAEDFKGIPPMRASDSVQVVGLGIIQAPLYDADPSDFLPDNLEALPYPKAKEKLLEAAFEITNERNALSPLLDHYNKMVTPGDFNRQAGQILSTLKGTPNPDNVGRLIQAHVNHLTPSPESQLKLAALTVLASKRMGDTERLSALRRSDVPPLDMSGDVQQQVANLTETVAQRGFNAAVTQFDGLKKEQVKVLLDTLSFPPKPDSPDAPEQQIKNNR